MPQSLVVIFRCKTASQELSDWEPCKPDAVPEWVTSEVNIGRMLDGMIVTKDSDGFWYRGERVDPEVGETIQ